MRTYNYFWDLKGATAYSDCMIRSYASHTTYGGGMFRWVPIVGVVTDIPAIRIQPSANTNGYFERVMGNEVHADWFGPVHANTTFAGAGISLGSYQALYPGVTVTTGSDPQVTYGWATTDTIDWAALQQAITYACNTNKPLMLGGTDYHVNKGLLINKFATAGATLNIDGGGGEIRVTNSNTFNVIGRPAPVDNIEAEGLMTGLKIRVANLRIGLDFGGPSNQTALALGPSYNNEYTNLQLVGMAVGLHLRFALNTLVSNCETNQCVIGFVADNGGNTITATGSWPGGNTGSSAQSNGVTFQNCRVYMPGQDLNSYGFYIINADSCSVKSCVVEGAWCENGIYFNSLGSTVVYNFTVDTIHFETPTLSPTYGDSYTNAAIKIKATAGNYTISNVFGQTAAILFDLDCSQETALTLSGVYAWLPSNTLNNMYRVRGNNSNILFLHNNRSALGDLATINGRFSNDAGTGGAAGITPSYLASLTAENLGGGSRYRVIPTTQ